MVYVLPPQLQLHQRREQEPSTGVDIDRDAAAGGGLNGRCVVGSVGCFSATRGQEGVDDTATAAWLFDGQAAVACVC